jgi:hypothetical protein
MTQPMTLEERNQIYNEIVFALMGLKVYKNKDIYIWDLDEPDMKRFKIMLKLYRDHGREFSGDFVIKAQKRKMIYNLYNNKEKKSTAYISKKEYKT